MSLDILSDESAIELKWQLNSQQMVIDKLSQDLFDLNAQILELKKVNAELLYVISTSQGDSFDKQYYLSQKAESPINHAFSVIKDLYMILAHEINHPLTIVSIYSSSCLLLLKNSEVSSLASKLIPMLENVVSQAEFAGKIVHNMKTFINVDDFSLEETDVNESIRVSFALLSDELIDINPKIIFNLADNLPPLMTNKACLKQIVSNLARNSIQALQTMSENNPELDITTYQQDGYIVVHMADNGPGIPPTVQNKIFNSLSTKRQGKGMGLGICRALIEMLNGEIQPSFRT